MTENKELALEAIEIAKNTGKIKKGINEATKALERGTAKLVAFAKDVQPAEVVMHLPVLAKEKNIPCIEVPSKEELGTAAGIPVPTSAVAIIVEGEAKKVIAQLKAPVKAEKKEEKSKEEPKKEAPAEKKEEKPAEKPVEKKPEIKGEEKKTEPKKEVPKEEPKPVEKETPAEKPTEKKVETEEPKPEEKKE